MLLRSVDPRGRRVKSSQVDPRGLHAAAAAFAAADDAVSEEEGEWALDTTPSATRVATHVATAVAAQGSSSVGALTAPASAPSSPDSTESSEWVKVPPHPTGCDPNAEATVEGAVARASSQELTSFAFETAELTSADEEAVMPFQLDPDFDYDAPIPNTERFSVSRALVEGEFYDRVIESRRQAADDSGLVKCSASL